VNIKISRVQELINSCLFFALFSFVIFLLKIAIIYCKRITCVVKYKYKLGGRDL